jgi:hypothetical protein
MLGTRSVEGAQKWAYEVREEVTRSIEWLIKRLIKLGAKVAHYAGRWNVHVAASFLSREATGNFSSGRSSKPCN